MSRSKGVSVDRIALQCTYAGCTPKATSPTLLATGPPHQVMSDASDERPLQYISFGSRPCFRCLLLAHCPPIVIDHSTDHTANQSHQVSLAALAGLSSVAADQRRCLDRPGGVVFGSRSKIIPIPRAPTSTNNHDGLRLVLGHGRDGARHLFVALLLARRRGLHNDWFIAHRLGAGQGE